MIREDTQQQSPDEYLTEDEMCIESTLVSCPFCGQRPALRARDVMRKESRDAPAKIEHVHYVRCECGAQHNLVAWQGMACRRTGWE